MPEIGDSTNGVEGWNYTHIIISITQELSFDISHEDLRLTIQVYRLQFEEDRNTCVIKLDNAAYNSALLWLSESADFTGRY